MKTISKLFIGSLLGIFLLLQTLSATAAPLATPDDTTWYIPLAFKDFHSWNTKIWIFNKSISVATFDIRWIPGGGGGCPVSWPNQVAPYSWVIVEPVSFCPGVASVYIRGWKQDLTGNVPIVVYSLNYAPNGATFSTQESYAIPSSQLRNWAALPLVTQNADWFTGVSIQNAGSITDSFTLHNATGGCSDGPYSIAPNASVNIVPSCHGTGVFNESYVTNASNANNVAVFVSTSGPNGNTFGYASALGEQFSSSIDNRISSNTAWWYGTYTIVHCKNTNGIAGTITLSGGTSNSISLPAWGVARFDGGASGNPGTFTTVSIDSGALMFCIVNGVYMNEYNAGSDGEWAYTVTDNVLPKMSPQQGGIFEANPTWQQSSFYNYGETGVGTSSSSFLGMTEYCPGTPFCTSTTATPFSPVSIFLGLNEPNIHAPAGRQTCSQDYPAYWNWLQSHAPGAKVSPAPGIGHNGITCLNGDVEDRSAIDDPINNSPTADGWLKNFRNAYIARYGFAPQFDFLAYHDYFSNPVDMISHLNSMIALSNLWGSNGVFLTEFNQGSPLVNNCTDASFSDMRKFLEYISTQPQLVDYSFFENVDFSGGGEFFFPGLQSTKCAAVGRDWYGTDYWTYR